MYLSHVNIFQVLANSLVFPPVKFVVNSYLFTCFSISSSSDDRVFFADFDGSCCCSVLFLAVPVSTCFVNSLGFWRIPASFVSS